MFFIIFEIQKKQNLSSQIFLSCCGFAFFSQKLSFIYSFWFHVDMDNEITQPALISHKLYKLFLKVVFMNFQSEHFCSISSCFFHYNKLFSITGNVWNYIKIWNLNSRQPFHIVSKISNGSWTTWSPHNVKKHLFLLLLFSPTFTLNLSAFAFDWKIDFFFSWFIFVNPVATTRKKMGTWI